MDHDEPGEPYVSGAVIAKSSTGGPAQAEEHTPAMSPLVEIERAVLERARGHDTNRGTLRALITDEVDRWQNDHRRGLRPLELADPDTITDRAPSIPR